MNYIVTGDICFDGKRVHRDFYFLVNDDKILKFGLKKDMPKGITCIDMKKKLVVPGFIDSHVHVCADPYNFGIHENKIEMTLTIENNLKMLLDNGITYIRDVGAPAGMMKTVKKMVETGRMVGPDIKMCGQAICATGGHGWFMSKEANRAEDVCQFVRENIKEGVDLIKLMVTGGINTPGNELAPLELTREEIQKGVEEAHRRGRKVAVHTHGRTGIEIALECGVDSIEHGLLMDQELAALAKEKHTYMVPTLSAPYFATVQGLKKDPQSKSFLKSKEVMDIHRKNTLFAYQTGVSIAMGSDSGTPFNGFDTVLEELVLLHDIGIPTEDVLRIATLESAKLLDIENTHGTLECGKQATFIVFKENPLEDMEQVRNIDAVYKNGVKVSSGNVQE